MLNYFSRLARLTGEQKQKAAEYLQMLTSDGDEKKRKELSEEDVLRIYAAVKLASADNGKEQTQSTQSTIVLNDFFKEKSRGFEVGIIPLFEKISETGQRLIYLSCDQPYPAVRDPLSTKEKKNDFKSLPLNFSSVTMR
jgi:hypothetical protein